MDKKSFGVLGNYSSWDVMSCYALLNNRFNQIPINVKPSQFSHILIAGVFSRRQHLPKTSKMPPSQRFGHTDVDFDPL